MSITYSAFSSRDCDLNLKHVEGLNFTVPILETSNRLLHINVTITNIKKSYIHIDRKTEVEGLNIDIECTIPYPKYNGDKDRIDYDNRKTIINEKNVFIAKDDITLGDFLDSIIFPKIQFLSLYNAMLMNDIGIPKDLTTSW